MAQISYGGFLRNSFFRGATSRFHCHRSFTLGLRTTTERSFVRHCIFVSSSREKKTYLISVRNSKIWNSGQLWKWFWRDCVPEPENSLLVFETRMWYYYIIELEVDSHCRFPCSLSSFLSRSFCPFVPLSFSICFLHRLPRFVFASLLSLVADYVILIFRLGATPPPSLVTSLKYAYSRRVLSSCILEF